MLTVREIMKSGVLTVTPDTTVRQLARLLADEEISGAPVVDDDGTLMGVVSATDVVRLAAEDAAVHLAASPSLQEATSTRDADDPDDDEPDPHGFFLPEDSPFVDARLFEQFAETELDAVLVRDIMTPVTFSVSADTTIQELAEFLVRGRIHRAVVLEQDRLAGIVTSGDVLRAVSEGMLG